jgi:MoxR-like ATPase
MITLQEKISFITEASKRYGATVTRQQLRDMMAEGIIKRQIWFECSKYRCGRAEYALPFDEFSLTPPSGIVFNAPIETVENVVPMSKKIEAAPVAAPKALARISSVQRMQEGAIIPKVNDLYVPFGFFDNMKRIIGSRRFYPVFVSGLSGNGKTFMVEQACAQLKIECLRVNISPETDEDDLIGGFRLIDGETKWFDGPVVQAMKSGAVLILDEIDRGSNKLMCLQGVLEGKGLFVKKTGEFVEPVTGFNVIATANTKGKGDDSGRYMAATILDDAFLERFPITVEQEYPDVKVETRILTKLFTSLGIKDKVFAENLVKWADIIRKTFEEGAIDELVSTRRLSHIAEAYTIFNDKMEAIRYCINRFDAETKISFLELYTKIDAEANMPTPAPAPVAKPAVDEEVPF